MSHLRDRDGEGFLESPVQERTNLRSVGGGRLRTPPQALPRPFLLFNCLHGVEKIGGWGGLLLPPFQFRISDSRSGMFGKASIAA